MSEDWIDTWRGRLVNLFLCHGSIILVFHVLNNEAVVSWNNPVHFRALEALCFWLSFPAILIEPFIINYWILEIIVLWIFTLFLFGSMEATYLFVITGKLYHDLHYSNIGAAIMFPMISIVVVLNHLRPERGKLSIRTVIRKFSFYYLVISTLTLLIGILRYWNSISNGLSLNFQF